MKKFFLVLMATALLPVLFAKASAPYPIRAIATASPTAVADTLKAIRIEQPTEAVFTGKEQIITWSCNFTDTVQIDLYKNEILYATIEYRIPSRIGLNSFAWNVPANFPKGGGYRLVIKSLNNSNVSGRSNLLTIKSDSKGNRKFLWIAGGLIVAAGLTFLGIQLTKPKTRSLPEPPLPDGQ